MRGTTKQKRRRRKGRGAGRRRSLLVARNTAVIPTMKAMMASMPLRRSAAKLHHASNQKEVSKTARANGLTAWRSQHPQEHNQSTHLARRRFWSAWWKSNQMKTSTCVSRIDAPLWCSQGSAPSQHRRETQRHGRHFIFMCLTCIGGYPIQLVITNCV